MMAEQRADFQRTPTDGLAQPLYFASGGKSLFGWLHWPVRDTAANFGLVICKPFGYEATCSHRSIRAFAEAAAKLGIPTLRFDYLGTGDSADIDPRANQLAAWQDDILAAIAELQKRTGVESVCLLGIRLGGLLAAASSARCRAVKSLILIAPVVSGARYLRELRTTRLAASLVPGAASDAAFQIKAPPDDSMEISGFAMSGATMSALADVDLLSSKPPPVPEILIIDGDGMPSANGWARSLSGQVRHTEYLSLPGLIEMIQRSPLRALVPIAMLRAITDWLQMLMGSSPPNGVVLDRVALPSVAASPIMTLSEEDPSKRSSISERPVCIDAGSMLFGIVTQPEPGERQRSAVILLNSGADSHIGANRMHVSLARRWARHGCVVLRLDLSGLGDSSTPIGCPDDDVFPATAVEEMHVAIDYLRSTYGIDQITLGGVCSGGYHALRAAVANLPVNQIFLVNPQNYFWKKGMRLDELQLAEVVRNPAVYLSLLFSRRAWGRLLAGEVSVPKIAWVYLNRSLLAVESSVRELARRLGIRLPRDLGSELEAIAGRGVRITFMFARGEPGIELLNLQGGSSVGRLGEQCRVHILDGGDHIFSQRLQRIEMEDVLTNELFTRYQPRLVGDLETTTDP